MNRLENKVAVITGGSSGLGQATALLFAKAGAKVVIANRGVEGGEETVNRIKKTGGEAIFVKTDVSKAAEVEALVTRTVETYGRLDCAFNNAGTEGTMALTADQTEENFERTIGVNLKGVWLCMKYELQQMLKQGSGAIVNMSSVNGLGGAPNASLYSASKHGVLGLTKSAAMEYAQAGIRINAMCAGTFRTPMLERVSSGSLEEAQAKLQSVISMGRLGQPEELAEAVLWLCSDAASYVTGHSMGVDGGFFLLR